MMKKVIGKIVKALTDENFLEFLWYILYVMWFGYVGRIIITSNQHIIIKILLIAGDLWWALYVIAQHHNNSNNE